MPWRRSIPITQFRGSGRLLEPHRIITAGGIASGMELGFHLLRRAGYDENLISEVARVMEYYDAYKLYKDDLETVHPQA